MNEYQKALDKLCDLGRKELTFREICEMEIAVETLQKLVEKATPKKVKDKKWTNGEFISLSYGKCPSCGAEAWGSDDDYCPKCGQALDWKIEVQEDE